MQNKPNKTIEAIFAKGKGIFAADERPSTIDARLIKAGIPDGTQSRTHYRDILFSTPTIEKHISGVIVSLDTLNHQTVNGIPIEKFLQKKNILVGLKVDGGLEQFEKNENLHITKGLTGLSHILNDAINTNKNILFTKWRSVIPVLEHTPSFLKKIIEDLVLYASITLETGFVPILEPEVLIKGNHTIQESKETLISVIEQLTAALLSKGISPQDCILKTSFALEGNNTKNVDADEVAKSTIDAFNTIQTNMPNAQFGGIVFLSGGLSPMSATSCLASTVALAKEKNYSTPMTFSYGRALQNEAMVEWGGDDAKIQRAKNVFLHTIERNTKALINQ